MNPDDAFDRLRAADPAAGTEPDLDAIRADVAAATGLPLAPVAPAGAGPAAVDDRAAGRRPGRNDWVRLAAAAAVVAVLGTGGYLAAGLSGGSSTADARAGAGPALLPVISLPGGRPAGAADSAPQAAGASAASGSAGSPTSSAAVGASGFVGGYVGRTVFTGDGLPTAGGAATAYAYDASGAVTAQTAARLAAVLGLSGEPRAQWGSWVVGPNDGTGPTLTIGGDGVGSLSYNDPSLYAWDTCGASSLPVPAPAPAGASGASDQLAPAPAAPGVAVAPVSPEKSAPPVPSGGDRSLCDENATPTGDAAVAKARGVLTSLGVDLTGAVTSVDGKPELPGATPVQVDFTPAIDGQATGVSWSVSLVGDGVAGIYGPLATLVPLGSYDVISPAQAVDRLNDPRFGGSGGIAYPMAVADGAAEGSVASAPYPVESPNPSQEPTVPPVPKAGAPIAWPVQQVTLTSARLGLAPVYRADGAQLLVPAYALTDTSGATWSVIAVVDDQLDFGAK
ncbi:MAG TPA: hypothetical protein VGC04_05210 [Cellulomonas sp.]